MKPSLSVIILTKNEAANIADCLRSAAWADEVLVYDSGSTDGTIETAQQLGARIELSGPWQGFGRQRQAAQKVVATDWILMLDADERVTPELRKSIELALAEDERNNVYALSRSSYFFGRFIRHSGWYPDRVVRLYSREHFAYNDAEVHEQLGCAGANVKTLSGDLLHYTGMDFQQFVAKSLRYATDWAKERHARGQKVWLVGAFLHAGACFLRKYLLQRGFLDGRHGLLLAVLASQYVFNKYAALWVLQRNKGEK